MKFTRSGVVLGVLVLMSCVPQEAEVSVVRVAAGPVTDEAFWGLVRDQAPVGIEVLAPPGRSGVHPDVVDGRVPATSLVDLGTALDPSVLGNFVPVAVDPRLQGGRLVRLVSSVSVTHLFFANRAVLEPLGLEPATSYEALVAQVPVLRAAGFEVVAMANREPWVLEATLFSTLVGRLAGADFVEALGQGRARFTDRGFVATLALIQDMVADGVLGRQTLLVGSNEVARSFAEGRAAYLIDGDWRLASLTTDPATGRSLLRDEAQKTIELLVFPTVPGQLPGAPAASVALGPGYGVMLGLGPREVDALGVVAAIEGASSQSWRLENLGTFPSRTDVSLDGLEPLEQSRGRLLRTLTGTPVLEGNLPDDVLAALQRGLRALVLGTTTPEVLATELQRRWAER